MRRASSRARCCLTADGLQSTVGSTPPGCIAHRRSEVGGWRLEAGTKCRHNESGVCESCINQSTLSYIPSTMKSKCGSFQRGSHTRCATRTGVVRRPRNARLEREGLPLWTFHLRCLSQAPDSVPGPVRSLRGVSSNWQLNRQNRRDARLADPDTDPPWRRRSP